MSSRERLLRTINGEETDLTLQTQICKGAGSGHRSGANVPFGCFQTPGGIWLDVGKSYFLDGDLE